MALEIGEHQREGVTISALKGRITVGEVTPVREKITQLLAAGRNKIVLDLQMSITSIRRAWATW